MSQRVIASGIDTRRVNTLVADSAQLLGRGDLHRIGGRVARSGHRAYACLFSGPKRDLTEETKRYPASVIFGAPPAPLERKP